MSKSKPRGLAKLPKEQRCHSLIGPVSSWFLSNTTDLWSQQKNYKDQTSTNGDIMDCDRTPQLENVNLSYFVYGSIGCFCYGEVLHRDQEHIAEPSKQSLQSVSPISASLNKLIDIKEDNSRVSCIRFLKNSPYPIVMALTESGSLLIHDCLSNENLIHFRKTELLNKLGVESPQRDDTNDEHCSKKAKLNVTQQINCFAWPTSTNIFIGISLLKEKKCFLVSVKVKDIIQMRDSPNLINKIDFIESHDRIELDLPELSNPICLIETALLDEKTCLVAVAMDNGLITIVRVHYDKGQSQRIIKLHRHNDQVSSMSLYVDNKEKFPLGLLASVSRDGLVLIWDIENEFFFSDYQAITDKSGSRINWFALNFLSLENPKQVCLAVSNVESGLTILDLPKNTRVKTRLSEGKEKQKRPNNEQTLRHYALLFDVVFDSISKTILTSSLDGNHIFWTIQRQASHSTGSKNCDIIEVKPQFLYPSMNNLSRTHMLRFSPIKEDLIGMALGKAGVRFYKIAENPMNSKYSMTSSCALISRKITKLNASPTSLAWHPSHEYRLAIASLEGRVFRVDITPQKASMVEAEHKPIPTSHISTDDMIIEESEDIFGVDYRPLERNDPNSTCRRSKESGSSSNHIKTDGVYSLCWGPNPTCPHEISRLAIYAVGSISHRLFIYYSNKENSDKLVNYLDEFLDQSLPEAIGEASEVAWKSSMDLMALGTTHGSIIIVTYLEESHEKRSASMLFQKVAVIQGPFGNTHIQCLAWHPSSDKDDAYYYYLAASSAYGSCAYVFNLGEETLVDEVGKLKIESRNGYEPSPGKLTVFKHKLDGHIKAITDIAWNPHEPNQLASSSFDRLCYVWSMDNNKPEAQIMSKFSARDRLFTVEWSLVDSDLIFTSGNDSIIWAWRPSQNGVAHQ